VFKEHIPRQSKRKITIYERKSWRLPHKIKKVDVFVSTGSLGYMDDIPAFIKHMRQVLRKDGRFCFYIKNSFINMTPNALEVGDKKKILAMFNEQKLEAEYKRRRKLFKEEIFIYGKK
jgi:SAM-dependent methyltransferase